MKLDKTSSPYIAEYVNARDHYNTAMPVWNECFPYVDTFCFPVHGPFEIKAKWNYEASPLQSRMVLLRTGSAYVGVQSLIAREFYGFKSPQTGALLCDYAVLPAHRSLGPAIKIQRTMLSSGLQEYDFAYGFSKEEARHFNQKTGFEIHENFPRHTFILQPEKILQRILGDKFTKILVKIYRWFLQCWISLMLVSIGNRTYLEQVDDFDESFDDLSATCKHGGLRLGERSLQYLRWRFGNSEGKYFIFKLVSKQNQKLLGYAVVTNQGKSWNIIDMLVIRHQPKRIKSLLVQVACLANQRGVDDLGISFVGSRRVTRVFRKLLFIKRNTGRLLVYTPGDGLANETWDANQWYITLADEIG